MEKCEDCSNVQHKGYGYCAICGGGLLVSMSEDELQLSLEEQEAIIAQKKAQIELEEAEAIANAESWAHKSAAVKSWKDEISKELAQRAKAYAHLDLNAIEIVTLQLHPSRKILRTLGLVKGISDLEVGLFSFKTQQTILESSFETAKRELIVSAVAVGANAVLGVFPLVNSNNPGSSTLAGGGMKSTETVILCGTAVVLE